MSITLGIDLGTQSIKTILYDTELRTVIGEATAPLELAADSDGSREQMASWWLDALDSCMSRLDSAQRKAVEAIAVSGQQHGFVPLAADGSVLAPVKLWCDTATTTECAEITEAVGGDAQAVALAGNPVAVGFTASKIRWLKKHKPDAYGKMTTILLPHDYINFVLTGRRVMECGDASGTALLDVRKRVWQSDMVRAVDADRDLNPCLPALIKADEVVGKVSKAAATRFGLSEEAIVAAGGGDNMMAAIGTGNVVAGRLTASLGTSGTLFGYADAPVIDAQGALASFCSSTGGWLPLLCTMNCTVATEQIRTLLDEDHDQLEAKVAKIPAGCDGVMTLPFYNGERTPALPNARGTILGLDMQNMTAGHLMRSAMESAIFGLRLGVIAFARSGMTFDTVTLTGGGSANPLWRQMVADILGLPVKVLKQSENAAMGAALQALWCLESHRGNPQSLQSITDHHLSEDTEKACAPDKQQAAAYDKIFEHYQTLVGQVASLYPQ